MKLIDTHTLSPLNSDLIFLSDDAMLPRLMILPQPQITSELALS